MIRFAKFTDNERQIVDAIIIRAISWKLYDDALMVDMDISATFVHCPLRLADLLAADDFNFMHDLSGIKRHLNRNTGKLEDFFLPRYTLSI